MSNSTSIPPNSRNHTTSVGKTEYRVDSLGENGVYLRSVSALQDIAALRHFSGVVQSAKDILETSIDSSFLPSTEQASLLKRLGLKISIQDGGYSNPAVINMAFELRGSVDNLDDANESDWMNFINEKIWNFFGMKTTFSSRYVSMMQKMTITNNLSQDLLWRGYDQAVIQVNAARANLVKPKPDFAFGLNYTSQSFMWNQLKKWKDKSIPSVDAFVTPKLTMPFLIVESKSNAGSKRTAENQLANAVIKAHDILCSLNLQDQLYVLGMVQIECDISLYMTFSTREIDQDRKPFADRVSCSRLLVLLLT